MGARVKKAVHWRWAVQVSPKASSPQFLWDSSTLGLRSVSVYLHLAQYPQLTIPKDTEWDYFKANLILAFKVVYPLQHLTLTSAYIFKLTNESWLLMHKPFVPSKETRTEKTWRAWRRITLHLLVHQTPPSGCGSLQKTKCTLRGPQWASNITWKRMCPSFSRRPQKRWTKNIQSNDNELGHALKLLRWFLWRWNTLRFGVVMKKIKLVMWFYAQSSYVTIWGKRESPDISNSVFKGGDEWEMEEDLGSSHLPIPRGLHTLSSYHPHMWEWLTGKAQPDGPPCQGEQDIGSVRTMKELPAVNQLMETLLISERHYGLRKVKVQIIHYYSLMLTVEH